MTDIQVSARSEQIDDENVLATSPMTSRIELAFHGNVGHKPQTKCCHLYVNYGSQINQRYREARDLNSETETCVIHQRILLRAKREE